jgi:hypothetical protein
MHEIEKFFLRVLLANVSCPTRELLLTALRGACDRLARLLKHPRSVQESLP